MAWAVHARRTQAVQPTCGPVDVDDFRSWSDWRRLGPTRDTRLVSNAGGRSRVASLGLGSHVLGWAAVYLLVALAPLFVVLIGERPEHRGFWIEFGVAIGFVSLAMMAMQSILTARFASVSAVLGQDTLLQFHRQAGLVAFALVVFHPVILIAADSSNWDFLDPRANLLRAPALWFALVAFPALIVTSLWRQQLRLPYEWWRLGHGVVALLLLVVGLVHITRVSYYLASPWKLALWLALGIGSIASVVYVRVMKPRIVGRFPYRVDAVRPLADRVWSVTVVPESGDVLDFRAGQFAFLTIGDSPFSLDQHPFSIASGPDDRGHVEFAIKELGDFTNRIGEVPVGARAYVDGPYGSMALHTGSNRPPGVFAVAGGIGISPIMSMIRAVAAGDEPIPMTVVIANNAPGDVAYLPELAELEAQLGDRLHVVHVVRSSVGAPTGDIPDNEALTAGGAGGDALADARPGLVSVDLLGELLPERDRDRWQYVLCGPPPLMEVAEAGLLEHGVPLDRIDAERFDIGAAVATGRRHTNVRRLVVAIGVVLLAASAVFAW